MLVSPSTSWRTRSATSTSPSAHSPHSRAATTTGIPKKSPTSDVTSPAPTPTRNSIGSSSVSFSRASSIWIPAAHPSAEVTDPNVAMTPSPVCLTSVPPFVVTTSIWMSSTAARNSSARSSPKR